jgi:hypothetical protein
VISTNDKLQESTWASRVAVFLSTSNAYRIRYHVTQKAEVNLPILNHLIILFNCGANEPHSIKGVYSYVVTGTTACYKILPYFDKYTLRSKKSNSYMLWKEVHCKNFQQRAS